MIGFVGSDCRRLTQETGAPTDRQETRASGFCCFEPRLQGRDGRFELDSPPPGDYAVLIDWTFGKCEGRLHIPKGDETIVDLGVRRCGQ